VKSTPTRGVKQYLKPNAYNQSELDWTLMTIWDMTFVRQLTGEHAMPGGEFAVAALLLGLGDMVLNHCPSDGCLARNEVPAYLGVSAGTVFFQENKVGEEIYLRHTTSTAHGPFNLTYGASVTEDAEFWIGLGESVNFVSTNQRWYAQFHVMPGLYAEGDGVDLGGPIEFRSGAEVGYQARNGIRYALSYDHRSNAGLYSDNPGLETVQFRVSFPLK
jgi:lipid A 3-O-deacylase